MPKQTLDLLPIFQAVTQALAENKQALDSADTYNQDHGTNMVQTFETITNALQQKQGATPGSSLKYAAKQLAKSTHSTSGQLYAQNLAQAASQIQGKGVDAQAALSLLQMLIGGGAGIQNASEGTRPQASLQNTSASVGAKPKPSIQGASASAGSSTSGSQQPGADLLGSLLGGLTGSEGQSAQGAGSSDILGSLLGGLSGSGNQPSQNSGGADLLGNLLGGLTGNQGSAKGNQNGVNIQNLLNAAMGFYQSKQSGSSNMDALLQAFLSGSGMGNSTHRQQSTQVVVNSFLQALSGMAKN